MGEKPSQLTSKWLLLSVSDTKTDVTNPQTSNYISYHSAIYFWKTAAHLYKIIIHLTAGGSHLDCSSVFWSWLKLAFVQLDIDYFAFQRYYFEIVSLCFWCVMWNSWTYKCTTIKKKNKVFSILNNNDPNFFWWE